MQFSIADPLYFILLHKLAFHFIHRWNLALQDTCKICVAGIQVASFESQVLRMERHEGQTFIIVLIYWLNIKL